MANMKGIYSSRGIEEACKTDIRFMWLLQYHKAPDHTTISRFLENNMSGCAEDLFYQLTEKLADMGEIDFEALFVDGTKIEANANKYTFVWAKSVEKRLKKLNERLEKELPTITEKHGLAECLCLESAVNELKSLAAVQGIKFVHGKGKRKTQLQRDCERLEELLNKGNEYVEHLRICGKRKSYSKTDTDATFMRMKEDHMRNGRLKPGYNLQAGVCGEYIVGLALFPNSTDTTTLIPFLERMKAGLNRSFRDIVADMGYAS
ncbi:MAG: transposase, partial [Clostridia bacterium]|nr:transposase [Clostridia bacterium]